MSIEHEELHDEDPAVTAAFDWAARADGIDWKTLAETGADMADKATIINAHRRRELRLSMLKAADRPIPPTLESNEDKVEDIEGVMHSLVDDMRKVLGAVAGRLPPAVDGYLRYMTEDKEGSAAVRGWLRHVGFSSAEIDWLMDDMEKADHAFLPLLEKGDGVKALLDNLHCGPDMGRIGFPEATNAKVPKALAKVITRFHSIGVTPGFFHLLPISAAIILLAEENDDVIVDHPSYDVTLAALVGARGTCYGSRNCSGKVYASNVTTRTCKRKRGKSLKSGIRCIKV